jgi:hypothetical protein
MCGRPCQISYMPLNPVLPTISPADSVDPSLTNFVATGDVKFSMACWGRVDGDAGPPGTSDEQAMIHESDGVRSAIRYYRSGRTFVYLRL